MVLARVVGSCCWRRVGDLDQVTVEATVVTVVFRGIRRGILLAPRPGLHRGLQRVCRHGCLQEDPNGRWRVMRAASS